MKLLKQVKEIGEYKIKKDESSSEEEYEQNVIDDDWDQVDVEIFSSDEISDGDFVFGKLFLIIYDCELIVVDIYKDYIVEIVVIVILLEYILLFFLIIK